MHRSTVQDSEIAALEQKVGEQQSLSDAIGALPDRIKAVVSRFGIGSSGEPSDPNSLGIKLAKLLLKHADFDWPKPALIGFGVLLSGIRRGSQIEGHLFAIASVEQLEALFEQGEQLEHVTPEWATFANLQDLLKTPVLLCPV
jgi:hypothetical protein